MRAILLLGVNFVRTQWIALAVMTAYILGIGGVFRSRVHPGDVLFFLRWHAGYAVFLGTMMAIPALQMERKTRRILAVLSKGIYRWQYIGGLLLGCAMAAGLFCLLVGGIAAWLCQEAGMNGQGIPWIALALFCSCVAASATGLFFSTFLHPLLATVATSVVLSFPFVLEALGRSPLWELFPVAWMFHFLLAFQLQAPGSEVGKIVAAALCQTAVFWFAAAVVFARRDVTISPE
jgi:ABC-type transport system involved in multi-copper enzyme maturation permease subunit